MKRLLSLALLVVLLAGCGGAGPEELPTPQINTSSAPSVEGAVTAYLAAWNSGDYEAMYAMLSNDSRNAITLEDFQARYANVATQANLFRVDYEILQSLVNPATAQVGYRVVLNSAVIGPIERDTNMDLVLESGNWRVVWDDRIILPELSGGNRLSLERFVPQRGIIYDNLGNTIAANTEAVAVGVYPELIAQEDINTVINELARVGGLSIEETNELLFPNDIAAQGYVPIAELSVEQFNARAGDWNELTGIYYNIYTTRLYFDGGAAAQSIGYYGAVPAEQVQEYIPLGYQSSDYIGRQGIESWGEEYLSGTRGGALYVLNPAGEVVTKLAESDAQPAADVYSSLDMELQLAAEEAIKDFNGAIVVLERDTGRVLAMVSSPDFNPNWADPNDVNSQWGTYFSDGRDRLFNRATQGQYPPGSIFKVITFSAALETGVFQPESTLDCQHTWFGLADQPLDDWTLAKELPPSGVLNLLEGLMRSCNPWFYQIGLDLYNAGHINAVAEMSRGFGLGSPTGIQGVPESSGNIQDPNTDPATGRNEAVQQAIGQGTVTITPLQAAVYAAAIGNGGTLYRPQLVDRVTDANGVAILDFEPEAMGTLPISANTLQQLQNAMRMVVADPRGTAYRRFTGFTITTYGKTGTATSGVGLDPHAWFIGYTDAGRANQPDIAIAVLVENIGEGSDFAAPIFRRVASHYFLGSPGPLYPWESAYGVLDPAFFDETLQTEDEEAEGEGDEETDDGSIAVTPSP
jgi:penicillin-binding protein 2